MLYGLGEIAKILDCSTRKVRVLAERYGAPIGWTEDGVGRRYHADEQKLREWMRQFATSRVSTSG